MDIDRSLNPEQREAVMHRYGPLLILAGAGSGKTRVITHRIAYLIQEYNVSPYNILAITFTNKAAREMKDRVAQLVDYGADNIWVSTFHSACVRMLRRFGHVLGYADNFSIYDTDDQKSLMKAVIKGRNLDPKRYREKYFLSRISMAKNELIGPESYKSAYPRSADAELIASVYREYQDRLKANNAMDFDDLLMNTVVMFRESEEALTYYRNRFRYILVDEYQDTNRAQFELVRLLAHYVNDAGEVECNLCVVGDDDQSIYGFRGADIRNILDFEKTYPDAVVIKLEENYRSTETILDAANEIIKNNPHVREKKLWTKIGSGAPITYTVYPDDLAEARGVAEEIRDQVDAGKAVYGDFAVLYRTNAQSRPFEAIFANFKIPCRIIGAVNFYQRKEVKDILAYLKTIDNGLDGIATRRILNVPRRGIGETTAAHVQEYADQNGIGFFEALLDARTIPSVSRAAGKIATFTELITRYRMRASEAGCSLKKLVRDLLADLDFEEELRREDPDSADDRIGNISELINAITYYEENSGGTATLSSYLADVSLMTDADTEETEEDHTVLMTVHSAKGLEFNQVFLVGMEENLFPSSMSIDDEQLHGVAEERRLCYVGITRARRHLFLSRASRRMLRGESNFNPESRFIGELKKNARHLLTEKKVSDSGSPFGGQSYRSSYDSPFDSGFKKGSFSGYDSSSRRGSLSDFSSSSDHSDFTPYKNPAISGKPYENPYKKAAVPAPKNFGNASESSLGFTVGDQVSHERFGIGTVTNIVKGGRDFEVTVDFPTGTKKMLAAFAKLRKI